MGYPVLAPVVISSVHPRKKKNVSWLIKILNWQKKKLTGVHWGSLHPPHCLLQWVGVLQLPCLLVVHSSLILLRCSLFIPLCLLSFLPPLFGPCPSPGCPGNHCACGPHHSSPQATCKGSQQWYWCWVIDDRAMVATLSLLFPVPIPWAVAHSGCQGCYSVG